MLRRLLYRAGLLKLPPAHQKVVDILRRLDEGEGVSWERLVQAARAEGLSEHEVELIMFGGPREDAR